MTGVWKEGIFGKNVGVAFIDDGLDYEHPDLADNYVSLWTDLISCKINQILVCQGLL